MESVVEALSRLEAACAGLSGVRKVIRLSIGPAFARGWLVERMGDFYRQHGDVDIEINATKLARDTVRDGEADIAIVHGTAEEWPDLSFLEIRRSEVFPVCSPDYLRAANTPITPASFVGHTLLRTSREPWKPWFDAAGIAAAEPDHGPVFSDLALMLDAALQGQGIALARNILIERDLKERRLVRITDVGIHTDSAYCAIYQPHILRREEIGAFLEWLDAIARRPKDGVERLSA